MNSYRIKYRGYWGNTVGYSVVEAESEEAAKAKVSRWGFVLECLECEKVLEIKESDLANNPPSHPGLQDLDSWTPDQMRKWIIDHRDEYETFVSVREASREKYERQQRIDDENHQHDLEHGTVPQGSHGYEEQEKHREGGVS